MCGAYNIINHPFVNNLTELFGVPNCEGKGWSNCGSEIQIILNDGESNQLKNAVWWLLLNKKDGKLKPSRYTSFNSRWRDGFSSSNRKPFQYSRCIIPARGFVEGKNKVYHYLEPVDQPVAFGGLYKRWQTDEGEVLSCSIITIDPHPKFEGIHEKAMPLMLPVDDAEVLEAWLDPNLNETDIFLPYMMPMLRTDFEITRLKKWYSFEADHESYIIEADT